MEQTPIVAPNAETDDRQPLWKQILGAVIGGALALGLYYGYEFAKPKVTAYLTLPTADRLYDIGAANIADKTMDEGRRKRILSRNVRASSENLLSAGDTAPLDTVDTHSLDIAWPGHDPENPKYAEVMGIEEEPSSEEVAATDEAEEDAMEVNILEEDMATGEAEMSDDEWEDLWGDIRDREDDDDAVALNAEALPDTGFGIGIAAAGAVGGAIGFRRKRSGK